MLDLIWKPDMLKLISIKGDLMRKGKYTTETIRPDPISSQPQQTQIEKEH